MTTGARSYRLVSLDPLRGLVIVIMALDHVRDTMMLGAEFDPTQNPHATPLLFLTRWITHFCAPTFGLLAGISAGLMQGRRTPNELAAFLVKRGLWLILIEVTIISPLLVASAVLGGPPVQGGIALAGLGSASAIGPRTDAEGAEPLARRRHPVPLPHERQTVVLVGSSGRFW